MNWADLFERAEAHRTDPETIRECLDVRREEDERVDDVEDGDA